MKLTVDAPDGPLSQEALRFVGSKTGLVRELHERLVERGAPETHVTLVEEGDLGFLVDLAGVDVENRTSGKGLSRSTSAMSAVGEVVERYALWWTDPASSFPATHEELRADPDRTTVAFDYLDVHGDRLRELLGLTAFDRTTELHWTPGTDLLTGGTVHLPAQLVWSDYRPFGDENRFLSVQSSGVAAGDSRERALTNAIEECVERDGVMRTWWRGEPPAAFAVDHLPAVERHLDSTFAVNAVDYEFFRLDSPVDVATVGCAVVAAADDYPKFSMSASAALDPEDAVLDALVESAQTRFSARDEVARGDRDVDEVVDPGTMTDLDDNAHHYARPGNFDEVAFLLDGDRTVRPAERWADHDDYEGLLRALDDAGLTPVAFDLTPRDVRQVGWHVVRVVVPELVGFTVPAAPPADHPAFDGDDLIDRPHPFP